MYPAVDCDAICRESASTPSRSIHQIPQKYCERKYRPISSAHGKENMRSGLTISLAAQRTVADEKCSRI